LANEELASRGRRSVSGANAATRLEWGWRKDGGNEKEGNGTPGKDSSTPGQLPKILLIRQPSPDMIVLPRKCLFFASHV